MTVVAVPPSWRNVKQGEVAKFINGKAFQLSEFSNFGTPVLRIQNLTGKGNWFYTQLELSNDKYIDKGDLIYAWSATFGPYIWRGTRVIYHYHIWKIECDRNSLDKIFFYYKLLDLGLKISDSGTGSIFTHITKQLMENYEILVPPLSEQKIIGRVLASFDDKIELNRQMNETLEAIARAIFKSWFVDFDPVRIKMDGGQPEGMDAETSVLFPCEFENINGQTIPKGWKVAFLPEVFEINPKRSLSQGILAPYLDMQNVPTQGHRPINWVDRAFGSGTKFVNGDTLLARITPCLENGKTIFVDFLEKDQTGWGSTEYIVLRPKAPLPLEFGYLLARDEDFRSHAIMNMSGSSGRQRVPIECFDNYRIVVPSKEISEKFRDIIHPFFELIKKNDEESHSLAKIRDFLLPRLISGTIRLPLNGDD